MPEEIVWRGNPSQWKNAGHFALYAIVALIIICVVLVSTHLFPQTVPLNHLLLVLLILPLFAAAKRFLTTRSIVYELTTERLKTSEGVFNKVTDTLELYRVKDIEIRQPFFLRMAGLEDVHLQTSDASSPAVIVSAVPHAVAFGDKTRNQVEAIRAQKGVREIDVE
jgi:membrane protein YdbS with pleckstrin-like domain